MKEIILKKDILNFIYHELARVKNEEPEANEIRPLSYMQGYKAGKIDELYRVMNYIWGLYPDIGRK